jgi:hypothetical protein
VSAGQLVYKDSDVAYHLWASLFPCAWTRLSDEERESVNKGCVQLLGKDYHSVQRFIQPNVMQALLHSLSRCNPVPSHAYFHFPFSIFHAYLAEWRARPKLPPAPFLFLFLFFPSHAYVCCSLSLSLSFSLQPPVLPGELVKYVGKTYNAWHTASAFLEPLASLPPPASSSSSSVTSAATPFPPAQQQVSVRPPFPVQSNGHEI